MTECFFHVLLTLCMVKYMLLHRHRELRKILHTFNQKSLWSYQYFNDTTMKSRTTFPVLIKIKHIFKTVNK